MLKLNLRIILPIFFRVHQDEYLDPKYFKNKTNEDVYFSEIKRKLKNQLDGKKYSYYPTKYYVHNHNHVPPWILFKNIALGTAINLFKLCNSKNKAEIAEMLLPQPTIDTKEKIQFISVAMNEIRYFRNCTAHNLNFIRCRTGHNIPRETLYNLLPKGVVHRDNGEVCLKDKYSIRGAFGIILSLYVLIQDDFICDGMILGFVSALEPIDEYIEPLFQEYLKIADIPLDIKQRLEKLLSTSPT